MWLSCSSVVVTSSCKRASGAHHVAVFLDEDPIEFLVSRLEPKCPKDHDIEGKLIICVFMFPVAWEKDVFQFLQWKPRVLICSPAFTLKLSKWGHRALCFRPLPCEGVGNSEMGVKGSARNAVCRAVWQFSDGTMVCRPKCLKWGVRVVNVIEICYSKSFDTVKPMVDKMSASYPLRLNGYSI